MSRTLRAETRTPTHIALLVLLVALAALPVVAGLPARAGGTPHDRTAPSLLAIMPLGAAQN